MLLDGAMGTSLHALGWPRAKPTVLANLEAPELVTAVHQGHLKAGARVLCTNTFSALMLSGPRMERAVRAGATLAQAAAGKQAKVAGSLAAFGLAVGDPQLRLVLQILIECGVDLAVLETANQVSDAHAAVTLHSALLHAVPLVVSASTTDGSHADRERVKSVIAAVQAAGHPGLEAGLNCGRGPHEALRFYNLGPKPVRWLKPSTGVGTGRVGPDVMAAFVRAASLEGCRFLGGCCGTDAETLMAMGAALVGKASR